MFLIVPFVVLCAFGGCLLGTAALKVRLYVLMRTGAAPSTRLLWWYRSMGQLTLVFFVLFVVTRVWYLL